jgi:hypothetical protein
MVKFMFWTLLAAVLISGQVIGDERQPLNPERVQLP